MDFFLLVLMTGAAYRIQRLSTSDTWPVSLWFRTRIQARYGEKSAVTEFFSCPWCLGSWTSFATVAVVDWLIGLRWPVLQAAAVATFVGLLARNLDD